LLFYRLLGLEQALQDKGQPELVEKLNKNVGFGMGLEFREGETAGFALLALLALL
jgi:hypothetical protein